MIRWYWISANLKPFSVPSQAYDRALDKYVVVRSAKTLEEFGRKIILPKFDKYLSTTDKIWAIAKYREHSLSVIVDVPIWASSDPDDDIFLELAVATHACCIVSGDPHLLTLHPFRGIPILKPADFLARF